MAVTVVSMDIGSINWLIILWLAAVNSAFAFALWNRTLLTLMAM